MNNPQLSRHVNAVQRYVDVTAPRYRRLMLPAVVVHPICFFGNINSAEIVTVGLNPSAGEFSAERWPKELEHSELTNRCEGYFSTQSNAMPHRWFAPWTAALGALDCSYENGSAVHVDLSPRATRYVRDFKDPAEQALFLDMVERDLWTFFGTLELATNAKLLLIAGSVTGEYYMNEFLQVFAPAYGYRLEGRFERTDQLGPGKTAKHFLTSGKRGLPVFFCSSSPSARDKALLPSRIRAQAGALREVMRGGQAWRAL